MQVLFTKKNVEILIMNTNQFTLSQENPSFNYLSLRSRKISGSTNYNDSSPPIHLDFYDAFH